MTLGASLRLFSSTRDRLRPVAIAPLVLALAASVVVFGGLFLFVGLAGTERPQVIVVSEVGR
ncbi:hypothetical protein [Consotaella aegiceratis]|uniref:hypothetical protein n=1 Tax=Consotaella aegiceratis TaxID=3097961 RepID=UPI002F404543